METLSLRWFTAGNRSDRHSVTFAVHPAEIARLAMRWAVAGAVAISLVLATTWAAMTPAIDQFLAAGIWALGFVFFALALEVGIRKIFPYLFTGLTLPALAVLGMEFAAEFSVLAGAIVAGWLFAWIVGRG